MIDKNSVYNGDCLELMKNIDDKSIDMILCDLPVDIHIIGGIILV
jgi:site-specific DNA-methyltransferase (adenine-specific)